MSNIAIPNLVNAALPIDGSDLLIINQSGLTKKVAASAFLNETIININNTSSNLTELITTQSASWSNNLNASVTTIYEAMASNNYVLAQQITNVAVNASGSLAASVLSLNQAIISEGVIFATQINDLSVSVDGKLNAIVGIINKAIVSNSSALFNQFVGISASLNNKIDFQVGQISNVIINDSSMLFTQMNGISLSLYNGLQAAVGTLNQAIISNSSALFNQIVGIRANVAALSGNLIAFEGMTNNLIIDTSRALFNQFVGISADVQTLRGNLTLFEGTINNAVITTSDALIHQVLGFSSSLSGNILGLATTVRDGFVSQSSVFASQITTVSSQLNSNIQARITQALSTVADLSHTVALEIDTLQASYNTTSGSIQLIQSVAASNSSLLLQRIVGVSGELSGALVNATNGIKVDIRGISYDLIQSIDRISSNVNGIVGSVSSILSSFNGIDNAWTLTLDSNGYVSGVTSVNNGNVASFTVVADTFTIAKAGSSSAVPAFSVNVETSPPTLTFLGKISADSISTGSLSTANLYLGTSADPALLGRNYFALEGANERMVVRDWHGTERIRLGYLDRTTSPGTTETAYGIAIWDKTGNLIVGAGGLGNGTVYPGTIVSQSTFGAEGAHIGDGNAIVGGTWHYLGNITINSPGDSSEGVMIMTSGLFTSGNATVATTPGSAPGYVPAPAPPAPVTTYTPPPPPEPYGGAEIGSCFLYNALVTMADGTVKFIIDIKVGEYVLGAFGEHNIVLALDHTILSNRFMYDINGEHSTSGEHPHVSVDYKFYSPEPEAIYKEWGGSNPVILQDGTTEVWTNVGLNQSRVKKLETGVVLQTVWGGKEVTSIAQYTMSPETKLYNLVMGGSHTYIVDGYAVTGWPREDDWDYDNWKPTGVTLSIDDYRTILMQVS